MKKGSLERRRTFSVGQFILTALMLLLAATMLVPILNIVANSFSDLMKSPCMSGLRIIPDGFSLLNYQIVLSNTTILPALFNSVKITIVGTAINILLTTMAAYTLTRPKLLFKRTIMVFLIIMMLFDPGTVPEYLTIKQLGLMGSQWSVILVTAVSVYYLIIMMRYFQAVSQEICESALVDGGYVKYAFSGDGSMTRANHMFNHAFGVTSTIMKNDDGKYVYYIATQAEKDLLAFYAQCYAEGLIDPDYLTSKWSDVQTKFYAGDLGMFCATQGGVVDSYCKKIVINQGDAAQGVVLPPVGGQSYISVSVAKETRGFTINADAPKEVKDAAFAVLDFMASPDGHVIDKLGLEGVHYNVVDGQVVLTERFDEWWSKFWETFDGLDENFVDKSILMCDQAWQSLDMAKQYYTEDVDVVLPEDMVPYYDSVFSLFNEYSTAIILGQRPVDDFDEFVQQYYQNGGEQLAEYLVTVLE